MKDKLLLIINQIRLNNNLNVLNVISETDDLRGDIGFNSFDLAELTVRIENEFDIDIFEDGIVATVGDILNKLKWYSKYCVDIVSKIESHIANGKV